MYTSVLNKTQKITECIATEEGKGIFAPVDPNHAVKSNEKIRLIPISVFLPPNRQLQIWEAHPVCVVRVD